MREMTLQRARLHEAGREGSRTHFARGLDALPDAEETDQPDEQEAESEVPLQRARLVNPGRQAQHLPPSSKQSPKSDGPARGRESRPWGSKRLRLSPRSKLWNPAGLGKSQVIPVSQSCGEASQQGGSGLLSQANLGSIQPGLGQVRLNP